MKNSNTPRRFGNLTLSTDTLRRLDVAPNTSGARGGSNMKPRDTKGDCPVSTKSKVTAHCC